MSEDINKVRTVWAKSQSREVRRTRIVTDVDEGNGRAKVEEVSKTEAYVMGFSGEVLRMLCRVCEEPGLTKTEYADGSKTSFNALTMLSSKGLVTGKREAYERHEGLWPTETGRSLYTGIWYATYRGTLVPKMEAAGLLIPFVFWSDAKYRIKELDRKEGEYLFTDAETGNTLHVYDVYANTEGRVCFGVILDGLAQQGTGLNFQGYSADLNDDFDLDDEGTKRCLRDIVTDSREKHAMYSAELYDDMLSDLDE